MDGNGKVLTWWEKLIYGFIGIVVGSFIAAIIEELL